MNGTAKVGTPWWDGQIMNASETAKVERIVELHRELDAAPNRKVGTPWWNDRIAELKRLLGN
jgi:hypothetical protein